jgi:hypothetical protein
VWAMGHAAPKPILFLEAEGPVLPEGNNTPLHTCRLGEEGGVSGGVFDHGTHEEDGPGTWEALASPRPIPALRRAGESSPTHDAFAGARVVGHSAQNKRLHRGRPLARGTGAVADGGRESEGCIGAVTSGNGVALGPGRAKAARVGVNFRREPCPMRRHWRPCHQDF